MVVQKTEAKIGSLASFTNYSVTVAASNSAGVGVASEKKLCSTLEGGEMKE